MKSKILDTIPDQSQYIKLLTWPWFNRFSQPAPSCSLIEKSPWICWIQASVRWCWFRSHHWERLSLTWSGGGRWEATLGSASLSPDRAPFSRGVAYCMPRGECVLSVRRPLHAPSPDLHSHDGLDRPCRGAWAAACNPTILAGAPSHEGVPAFPGREMMVALRAWVGSPKASHSEPAAPPAMLLGLGSRTGENPFVSCAFGRDFPQLHGCPSSSSSKSNWELGLGSSKSHACIPTCRNLVLRTVLLGAVETTRDSGRSGESTPPEQSSPLPSVLFPGEKCYFYYLWVESVGDTSKSRVAWPELEVLPTLSFASVRDAWGSFPDSFISPDTTWLYLSLSPIPPISLKSWCVSLCVISRSLPRFVYLQKFKTILSLGL
jgi:hypothetical protein